LSLLQLLDEQTKYSLDPGNHFSIIQKFPLYGADGGIRIDVGPGRQYIAIHHFHNQLQKSPQPETHSSSISKSVVFITRSRVETTKALESLASTLPAHFSTPIPTGSSAQQSTQPTTTSGRNRVLKINQNMEWAWRFVQSRILLQPATAKLTRILSYNTVWGLSEFGPEDHELSVDEFDAGVHDPVSPVDFAFIKTWIQGIYLRYFKPVEGVDKRGVESCAVSFVVTGDYVYVVGERMDVWPPPLFPPESMTTTFPNIPPSTSFTVNSSLNDSVGRDDDDVFKMKKGLVADVVSPFSLMGVGRVRDISRLERWRSWRLNTCHSETPGFRTLGTCIQNGLVGYHLIDHRISSSLRGSALEAPSSSTRKKENQKKERNQQGSASGFLWWCRVYFGYQQHEGQDFERPASPPSIKPGVGYWWDICFRCRESCQEFMDVVVEQRQRYDGAAVQVILGDD
jgi:hypothetical protein